MISFDLFGIELVPIVLQSQSSASFKHKTNYSNFSQFRCIVVLHFFLIIDFRALYNKNMQIIHYFVYCTLRVLYCSFFNISASKNNPIVLRSLFD